MNEFTRNCPNIECNRIIQYKNAAGLQRAIELNTHCKNCFKNPNPDIFIEDTLQRKCPNINCDKIVTYKSRAGWLSAIRRNTKCPHCVRRGTVGWTAGLTKDTDPRIANIATGLSERLRHDIQNGNPRTSWCKGLTADTDIRLKNRKPCLGGFVKGQPAWNKGIPWSERDTPPPMLGKTHSEETKRILRVKRTTRFIEDGIGPNFNKTTLDLFEQINTHFGWAGIYANHPKEFYIKGLGYWVDYYEPTLNLVIEYYEKHHNHSPYKNKDLIRQQNIIDKLSCKFYIIKEWEVKDITEILINIEAFFNENNKC